MRFERVFTANGTVGDDIWEKRDALIMHGDKVVFEQKGVEVPKFWSDNALNIVASKYFKTINGVKETSVKQLIARVVNKIVGWGEDFGYFKDANESWIFADELTWLLTYQYASFNSPIWFNFGVPGREQQAAACFLIGLEDSSESIRSWMATESKIFKGGSGSGINLTPLRRKNAELSTGGYSSGPMSFTKAADYNAGVWKSGGATRRAATLRRMNVTHPDIEEFITCKVKEERKAKALIAAGYDSAIDGEAYSTVAFQNMNHSVGVSDVFMKQVIDGDPESVRLLKLMSQCAWESGDPGIQYDDIINKWNTIPNSGRITTSNPCGEYLSTDWSSCLLASFNLIKYKKDGKFDFETFTSAVKIFTTALDIIIDGADYPDPRFKDTAHRQRQLGLGYSNLGALLMSMGLPYGSEEGRRQAAEITSCMTAQSYIQSTNIAQELGPFADYEKNKDAMISVIAKQAALAELTLSPERAKEWEAALSLGCDRGYRNATNTLIAPTGTISFMMDCDTTGIESELALVKYKKLVGGGTLIMVNNTVVEALKTLDYIDWNIDSIVAHINKHGTIEGAEALVDEDLPVFDCSLKPQNGNRFIDYHDHIKMVASVQPFLSMGISKTINMPNHATPEDIYKVYIDGWKLNIKSISIYRDGSKHSQPLNVGKESQPVVISQKTARRALPPERPSLTHKMEVNGFECYLHVGLFEDGTPGELFINSSKLGSTLSGLLDSFAISISFGLQYGVPLDALVEKFLNTRFEPSGFTKNPEIRMTTSIIDYIFRWMKARFVDGEPTLQKAVVAPAMNGDTCRCGSMLVTTGTCHACPSCGEPYGGCG